MRKPAADGKERATLTLRVSGGQQEPCPSPSVEVWVDGDLASVSSYKLEVTRQEQRLEFDTPNWV